MFGETEWLWKSCWQSIMPDLYVRVAKMPPAAARSMRRNAVCHDCPSFSSFPSVPSPQDAFPQIVENLLEVGSSLRELKVDTLSGQTLVDLGVCVETVVDAATLLLVEQDLENLGAVLLGAHALADNLHGVDKIGEDGIVDSGQRARTWALLGLRGAAAVGALGAWENTARGDDDDVTVGELLLEFTGEAESNVRNGESWCLRGRCGRTHRCCERCHPTRSGTGTKMTIALRPWPTSICKIPGQREAFQCPPPLQLIEIFHVH